MAKKRMLMEATTATDFPLLILEDKNTNCYSILATLELQTYLDLVSPAYQEQGGLEGQRAPIKTKTGLKIRGRLIHDLENGAVIPPVVIGVVCRPAVIKRLAAFSTSLDLARALHEEKLELSIIDGMQRTTALIEASHRSKTKPFVRVELWLARKVDSLIYRMLVLNTGQVPWDIKRQLDTLYRPIVAEIKKKIPHIRVIGLDQANRRSQASEYRSTRIIELFLAFTSRSVEIDIKEKVAEEFVKIDITEATSNDEFLFIDSLSLMAKLDEQFDRVGKPAMQDEGVKIGSGRDIFTSAPASIGFIVALAEQVLGSPGFDYDIGGAKRHLKKIQDELRELFEHMNAMSEKRLQEFVDLDTLNQVLSAKSGRIGDYERNVYKNAFTTLTTKVSRVIAQGSMAPCWRTR